MQSDTEKRSNTARFKILCLHGIGTNSEIFEAQTAGLRYQLGEDCEYDFVDGGYDCPAASGIREIFGDEICYSYFDSSADSVIEAVQDLYAYTNENGPFDAVMGFSLGAALAVMLLLYFDRLQTAGGQVQTCPPFKCAILLCGILPYNLTELERGRKQVLHPGDQGNLVRIPTVHGWSPTDVDYAEQSRLLMHMCEPAKRVEIAHSAGHSVPSRGEELSKLAQAICSMMGSVCKTEM